MIKILEKNNFFTILTKFLIIILPFYVIIKVYFSEILGLGFFGFFIKEFIIILLFISFVYEQIKSKKKLKFDLLDYLISIFIIYGIIITIVNNGGIKEIILGGRYDFLGFIIFFIYKHGKTFLTEKKDNLIKLFLFSASLSLFFGIMVKFILKEEFLQLFGFSLYVADFNFKGGIPIYQGVEASGIRRFQGILDSPLAMGFYLILFTGLYSHINRKKFDYAFFLGLIILFSLLFLTYSRAAMLGILFGISLLFLLNFKKLFKKYKKIIISLITITIILFSSLAFLFQDKLYNVFLRKGSTSEHITRMYNGINRFKEKPLGAGLSSSGPAYRYFVKETSLETDKYYIPESWFIQILIEGGIIYFLLYLLIIGNILKKLFENKYYYILITYIGVLIMSIFLHIFEYTYLTILLYLFLGIFIKESK